MPSLPPNKAALIDYCYHRLARKARSAAAEDTRGNAATRAPARHRDSRAAPDVADIGRTWIPFNAG